MARIDAVRFVIPTHFLRLTEPPSAKLVTHLPIFSHPEVNHLARITRAEKLVPFKLELAMIVTPTVYPLVAI